MGDIALVGYNSQVEAIRDVEYPMLKGLIPIQLLQLPLIALSLDTIYLDHAGTTLYAKSLMERFTADMISNLYGNPHSSSSTLR